MEEYLSLWYLMQNDNHGPKKYLNEVGDEIKVS